jgi:hypothetical protein
VPVTKARKLQPAISFEYYHDTTKEHGAPASGWVYVSWDGPAGEWVEWERGEFLEGYEQGTVVYLPYEKERASAGIDTAERILEMYGLSRDAIDIERVRTTSPEVLRHLGEQEQS